MDMSSKRIKGNSNLRRGLGSKTTDSDKIMEDPPAGDWLALRSDQLLKWIDDSNKCDFKLLFKTTHDGFGSADFHKKCDGKGANISIIKSDKQCIFGGYSSNSWHKKTEYIEDNFAWLYSLKNKKRI